MHCGNTNKTVIGMDALHLIAFWRYPSVNEEECAMDLGIAGFVRQQLIGTRPIPDGADEVRQSLTERIVDTTLDDHPSVVKFDAAATSEGVERKSSVENRKLAHPTLPPPAVVAGHFGVVTVELKLHSLSQYSEHRVAELKSGTRVENLLGHVSLLLDRTHLHAFASQAQRPL